MKTLRHRMVTIVGLWLGCAVLASADTGRLVPERADVWRASTYLAAHDEFDAETIDWYRKAAEAGNSGAQNIMGVLYEEGRGVPQSYREAAEWYRRAAMQGDALAQYKLGLFHEDGRVVRQDFAQAYIWYDLAVGELMGETREDAVRRRDRSAARLPADELAKARRMVREWKPTEESISAPVRPPSVGR